MSLDMLRLLSLMARNCVEELDGLLCPLYMQTDLCFVVLKTLQIFEG